jgi:hypothetical protein
MVDQILKLPTCKLVKQEHKNLLKKHKEYLFDKAGSLGKFLKTLNGNSSEECQE